jgi:hypothetical protein
MDEHRHKILVVLIFTMAMNQIIAQVILLQQIIIAQHWNMISALLFFQEFVDMPPRVWSIIYCKGRMKLPLTPDGQWLRTVKVVLVHSYGPQNNDKVKELANEVAVLPRKPSARQGC